MIRLRRSPTQKQSSPLARDAFGVRTRIVRAVGDNGRYTSSGVRVLPNPAGRPKNRKADPTHGVVLQATDGRQAVCLLSKGQVHTSAVVPAEVLPTRKLASDVLIHRDNGHWRSSEGRSAEYRTDGSFPPVADVLPELGKVPFAESARHAERRRRKSRSAPSDHIVLGLDVDLLRKVSDALGNTKLTLFIPVPIANSATKAQETYVNKPVAVCPATTEGRVPGIGVVMPLVPEHGTDHYEKLRQKIVEAEHQAGRTDAPKARGTAHPDSK